MATTDVAADTDFTGIRASNAARCVVSLRDHGQATATELSKRTGLSRPTVDAAMLMMIERGTVLDDNSHTNGGRGAGRPAKLYSFASKIGYLVGVDVGIHRVRVAVADASGHLVGMTEEIVDTQSRGQDRMLHVKRVVQRGLDDAGVGRQKLISMCVAVSGLVGADGRLFVSANFPDWEGVDVAGHLRAEFNCAVAVENDIRLAALAEQKVGAARLMDDIVYFSIGHRIAMGLIIGGELRHGRHHAAGEIGDLIFADQVNAQGELEWSSGPTGEAVVRQAAEGDVDSLAEIQQLVNGISKGFATVAMVIDPDAIVVGGGLSRAGEVLLNPLRKAVAAEITVPVRPLVIASELGAEAVVIGALVRTFSDSSNRVMGVEGIPGPTISLLEVRSFSEAMVQA